MKFGLKESTIVRIQNAFAAFPEIEEAILFGSRAKGDFRSGSDTDITLKGTSLNLSLLNKILLKIEDLFLPYTFDISVYHQIDNPELLDHIQRIGICFYKKGSPLNMPVKA
ncbi:MAG: nucleotidyltransferase domain-containing protein [Leptospira sp.]|nr:nucleotidyltransferase domain-containing protein [Leptospira sp.]